MLDAMIGQPVVIDLRTTYVVLGTLHAVDDHWLDVRNADFHDLRDSDSTREQYVAMSLATGVKRNRKRVLVVRGDVIAVSLLKDVTDE